MSLQVYFIRHGETAWSLTGQHTSRTEIPLTLRGESDARNLAARLASVGFVHVFMSPRQRARRTCELAGLAAAAKSDPDLAEWDYGDYEGLRSAEIVKERPGWNIFSDGCPNGELPSQVSIRADRLIARLRTLDGNVALFSHAHFGRAFAARWIGLPVAGGERFLIDPTSLGILGFEHGNPAAPVIALWNESSADLASSASVPVS